MSCAKLSLAFNTHFAWQFHLFLTFIDHLKIQERSKWCGIHVLWISEAFDAGVTYTAIPLLRLLNYKLDGEVNVFSLNLRMRWKVLGLNNCIKSEIYF